VSAAATITNDIAMLAPLGVSQFVASNDSTMLRLCRRHPPHDGTSPAYLA
jgi:hypothetical protein